MRLAKTIGVGLLVTSGLVVQARASEEIDEEDDNNFREDVIVCEEAVAQFESCCQLPVPASACRYYSYRYAPDCGCDSAQGLDKRDIRPVLSIAEGRRIAAMECGAMKAECDRIHLVLQKSNMSESYGAHCP